MSATYPWIRRQVLISLAALADARYQERVWIHHDLPFADYYDELDVEINVLLDDYRIFPDPSSVLGDILLPTDAIARLQELGVVFGAMIRRLGDVPDEAYLSDPEWHRVVTLAGRCLPSLILSGAWDSMDNDAEIYTSERAEGRIPTVELPATRRRVIKAVAALADEEFQRRTWPGGADTTLGDDVPAGPVTSAGTVTSADPATADLNTCLHTLTDDAHVLPHPTNAIGWVLLPGDEIDRLHALDAALEPFHRNDTAPPWDTPAWSTVVTAALHCLPALVIAGAWIGPDQRPQPETGTG